jgi:hypothetical protein
MLLGRCGRVDSDALLPSCRGSMWPRCSVSSPSISRQRSVAPAVGIEAAGGHFVLRRQLRGPARETQTAHPISPRVSACSSSAGWLAQLRDWRSTHSLCVDRACAIRLSFLVAAAGGRCARACADGASRCEPAAAAVSYMRMSGLERWLLYVEAVVFLVMVWRWMP